MTAHDLLKNAIILDTECVSGDTLVQLEDGSIVEIQGYTNGQIWGSSSDGQERKAQLVEGRDLTIKDPKPCYLVKPKWGLPVKASANHYFLTQRGWVKTIDLTTNDYVLTASSGPEGTEIELTDDELKFVGWFIAEGCQGHHEKGRSVAISVVEQEYRESLPNPWPDKIKIRPDSHNSVFYSLMKVGRDSCGDYRRNPAADLLDKLNLLDKYCYNKSIPQCILRASNRQIAVVIATMWQGDGTIFRDRLGLSYTTTSKRLAEQLVILLARFGILSSISSHEDNRKESYKTVWNIQVSGGSALTFFEKIPLEGRKYRELADVVDKYQQRICQRNIPLELMSGWKEKWLSYLETSDLKHPRDHVKTKWYHLRNKATYDLTNIIHFERDWPEHTVRELALVYPEVFSGYLPLIFEGMVWTPIKKIELDQEEILYDITTSSAEFFAGTTVVHNTIGLHRGTAIHEIALYDLQSRQAYEYLVNPQIAIIKSDVAQDVAKFASSPYDAATAIYPESWKQAIRQELEMQTGKVISSNQELNEHLKDYNPFLYDNLVSGKYPHLIGKGHGSGADTILRQKALAARGIAADFSKNWSLQELLKTEISEKTKGKTIWIANSSFESKVIGAHLSTMPEDVADALKNNLETRGTKTPEPYYVTGREINIARTEAQITGDWTKVWKAYLAHPPKAGETAVRDILDVSRAFMSYGKQLGMFKGGDNYFGTSIDVSYRLLGSLEKDQNIARAMLLDAETHRALEDAAIHESYVLEKMSKYTEVLSHVQERTSLGKLYMQQAARNSGPLAEAARYFQRLEHLAPALQKSNLIKRLGRAQEDLMKEGVTYQTLGYESIEQMQQLTPNNQALKVPRAVHNRVAFNTYEDLVSHLNTTSDYGNFGIDINVEAEAFRQRVIKSKYPEKEITKYVTSQTKDVVDSFIRQDVDRMLDLSNMPKLQVMASRHTWEDAGKSIVKGVQHMPRYGQTFAAAAIGLAAFGSIWSLFGTESSKRRADQSVLAMNYQEWTDYQARKPGLQPQGFAKESRASRTDFGSPWQGPGTSMGVLADQELLQEREKFLRQQFQRDYYDPEYGLFGALGPFGGFNILGRRGYSYITGGTKVSSGYHDLRGNNLMSLNLSEGNWKVTADDADTITVKKGGIQGAISGFFGLNRGYTFRLAGVDATEISHGDKSYHAPQPFAEAAAAAFSSMIKGSKNLELVYDPTNTTYGRMMGAVIADGKNLNFEVVRQGLAAHLPYGKAQDSMIDYRALKEQEDLAYESNRGLWANGWAKAFKAHSDTSGNRLTFNTLSNKSSIVKNSGNISLITTMEMAQQQGSASTYWINEAATLGKTYQVGNDKVQPQVFMGSTATANASQNYLQTDLHKYLRQKGKRTSFELSHTYGVGDLNESMVLDSLTTTNSSWNRRQQKIFDLYPNSDIDARQVKKARHAGLQRQLNSNMFVDPNGSRY